MNFTDVTCMVALAAMSMNDPGALHAREGASNWNDYWAQQEFTGDLPPPPNMKRVSKGRTVARLGASVNAKGPAAQVRCIPKDPQRGSCEDLGEAVVPCPAPTQPNITELQLRMLEGPVRTNKTAEKPPNNSRPLHLIILAAPFTGSTALMSLLATSPEVSGLCKSWLCEGMWLIKQEYSRKNISKVPDWGYAFWRWDIAWNFSRSVHVEKSPDWIYPDRVDSLLRYARYNPDRDFAFLLMTRSKCYGYRGLFPGPDQLGCHDQTSLLARALQMTKQVHLPYHVVHYEDLISDPYGTAQGIVDAFPALQSLDPAVDGMPNTTHGDEHHPQVSLAQYAVEYWGNQTPGNDLEAITQRQAGDAACLGYRFP